MDGRRLAGPVFEGDRDFVTLSNPKNWSGGTAIEPKCCCWPVLQEFAFEDLGNNLLCAQFLRARHRPVWCERSRSRGG